MSFCFYLQQVAPPAFFISHGRFRLRTHNPTERNPNTQTATALTARGISRPAITTLNPVTSRTRCMTAPKPKNPENHMAGQNFTFDFSINLTSFLSRAVQAAFFFSWIILPSTEKSRTTPFKARRKSAVETFRQASWLPALKNKYSFSSSALST